jgi:hypothetical protein
MCCAAADFGRLRKELWSFLTVSRGAIQACAREPLPHRGERSDKAIHLSAAKKNDGPANITSPARKTYQF